MLRCDTWILFCLMISGTIRLNCTCSEHALHQALFKDYNKLLRPVKNQSTTTFLKSNTDVYSIVSVNEQEESIDLVLWDVQTWQDEFLQWNPTDFDNCTSLYVPASEIWQPDYVVLNLLNSEPLISDSAFYVRIESNGLVAFGQTYYATLRCDMDITAFPFDTQTCPILGMLWLYDSKQINLTLSDEKQNLSTVRTDSAEFERVSFEGHELFFFDQIQNKTYSELRYDLKLRRLPEYYIYVLVVPSFLLTSLCIIGIFTPNSNTGDRNEKMTLGLTTLLSMAVILNITADAMPKSAKGLPLLGYYVLYEIGMCSLATILSTVIMFTHERATTQDWDPPAFIHWIANLKTPCQYFKNAMVSTKSEEPPLFDQQNELKLGQQEKIPARDFVIITSEKSTTNDHEVMSYLRRVISKIDENLDMQKKDSENKKVWSIGLDRVDTTLLILLLISNCILTAVMLF